MSTSPPPSTRHPFAHLAAAVLLYHAERVVRVADQDEALLDAFDRLAALEPCTRSARRVVLLADEADTHEVVCGSSCRYPPWEHCVARLLVMDATAA